VSVDDHGAGSECSVLIHYSHNSHSLFSYSVDLALEVVDHGHMRLIVGGTHQCDPQEGGIQEYNAREEHLHGCRQESTAKSVYGEVGAKLTLHNEAEAPFEYLGLVDSFLGWLILSMVTTFSESIRSILDWSPAL